MTETPGETPEETPAPAAEPAAPADTSSPTKSLDERKAILDRRLAEEGAQGWRIENRSDFQATVATGKPVHHLLHFFLTIFTVGLWLLVWIPMTFLGGVKRRLLSVDDYGNVIDQKI